MDEDVIRSGLTKENLTTANVMQTVILVVVSIFASLFFSRVENAVSAQRLMQITLIATSITFALFVAIRRFIDSRIARDLNKYSRDYWRLILEVAKFLRSASIILVTHFVSSTFINMWSGMQMSAFESFDALVRTFLFVYLTLQLFNKTKQ